MESRESAAKKTTRRRAPRKAAASPPRRAPAATPKAPPSEDNEVNELLGLLRTQSGLIETQNQLLKSLVDAQAETTRAIRGSGGLRNGSSGPAMEVKPRLAVFVDVPNILYAAERSGVVLDWGKVLDFLSEGRTLVRATAYAPISDDPAARRENERFVVPFMDRGYRIATKPLKRFTGGSVKANFDVELAVDIVTMADRLDVISPRFRRRRLPSRRGDGGQQGRTGRGDGVRQQHLAGPARDGRPLHRYRRLRSRVDELVRRAASAN